MWYEECPGLEYVAKYSNEEGEECGINIDVYKCHHCYDTFIYGC